MASRMPNRGLRTANQKEMFQSEVVGFVFTLFSQAFEDGHFTKREISFENVTELREPGCRIRTRGFGLSKGHRHPGKKYIGPVFMFGHMSSNRIPDVLIAWNKPDRRSDGEIVENFHSHFVIS